MRAADAYKLLTGSPMPVPVDELTSIASQVPELEAALVLNHAAARAANPTEYEALVTLIGADEARHIQHMNASRMVTMTIAHLMRLGLSREAATRIHAAFTLARAAAREEPIGENVRIRGPADVDKVMRDRVATSPVEEVWFLYLDSQGHLLALERSTIGLQDAVPLDVRTVVRRAFELNAAGLIFVHNHPSAQPRPSEQDALAAANLIRTLRVAGLALRDAVIIGRPGYVSLFEAMPILWEM